MTWSCCPHHATHTSSLCWPCLICCDCTWFACFRRLVKQPRLAGTRGDLVFATFLRDFFLQQGFHSSKLVPYNVLLSFPDLKAPSHVELYDRRENLVFTSQYENEAGLHNWNGTEAAPPFSAYSAIGSPKVSETCNGKCTQTPSQL